MIPYEIPHVGHDDTILYVKVCCHCIGKALSDNGAVGANRRVFETFNGRS